MMKAIRVSQFGGPEVLKLVSDLSIPECKPGEVVIQVKAIGVNPADTYKRSGSYPVLPSLPYTPGSDAAGVILHAPSPSRFSPGDRVYTRPPTVSTYASHVAVPVHSVLPLPDPLSMAQGAALGVPYYTAYRALVTKGRCQKGETVLIHGASGAVGLACCQLARALGLRVFGTAGTVEGMSLVEQNGAHSVFNHRQEGYVEAIKTASGSEGISLIVEMLANKNLAVDCQLLGSCGRLMIVGSRGSLQFDPRLTMGKELVIQGVALLHSTPTEWTNADTALQAWMNDDVIKPVIHRQFSLVEAPEAHRCVMENEGSLGKLVITVDDE